MSSRRFARILALQCLFANEFLNEDPKAIAHRVATSLDQQVDKFALQLIEKTSGNEKKLNDLIKGHLRNWEYKRVSIFDRVLIKMAVAEMLYFPDIPVEVSINEALEISKEFCNLKSKRFINGMLDSIYKRLKETDQIQKDISVKAMTVSQKRGATKKNNSKGTGN
jgi:transcription antitermination protein NusB